MIKLGGKLIFWNYPIERLGTSLHMTLDVPNLSSFFSFSPLILFELFLFPFLPFSLFRSLSPYLRNKVALATHCQSHMGKCKWRLRIFWRALEKCNCITKGFKLRVSPVLLWALSIYEMQIHFFQLCPLLNCINLELSLPHMTSPTMPNPTIVEPDMALWTSSEVAKPHAAHLGSRNPCDSHLRSNGLRWS